MTISATHVWSDLPVSPGSVLEEEIEARGMSQRELARRMGRPVQVVNEIIKAKKAITPETALELEKVLGMSAHLWLNLETVYRLTLARNAERATLEREASSLSQYPVREMERRGWISRCKDRTDKARAVLEFLSVASFEQMQTAGAFRITGGDNFSEGSLSVWLRKGEVDGQSICTAVYDKDRFNGAIKQIRKLTLESPDSFAPQMQALCAEAGVAFVLTKELPKSGANGAARWLGPHKALVQLSLKWKWADVFWFTFFHEAGHILLHQHRSFVEGVQTDGLSRTKEDEADRFAADCLIPAEDWDAFVSTYNWTEPAVHRFAEHVGIHPGIVVGRLHHEKLLPYNCLSTFKERFVWVE